MTNPDIDLELWVLRANVSGIIQDVREVKTRAAGRPGVLKCPDEVAERACCDRLQGLIARIEERVAALELRCCHRLPGGGG